VSRDPLLFLEDIEKSCEKVVQYTKGRSKDQVFEDDIRAEAVLLNLHIIGEAVKKLPGDLRERYPDVAWREIAGLRDFIAHTYFALDSDILWDAVERDVPTLLDAVRRIIRTERRGVGDDVTGA
jgi:uncharacterized protein with HEPN domain